MSANEECQFYNKVGVCRHGNKCVRKHTPVSNSKILILVSMPLPLRHGKPVGSAADLEQLVQNLFVEIALIAPVQEILISANDSPHLKGNVYIAFANNADAAKVLTNMNSRWFNEQPVFAVYHPSQSLGMAVCREGNNCRRKMDCNYVHPLEIDPAIWTKLFAAQAKQYRTMASPSRPGSGIAI